MPLKNDCRFLPIKGACDYASVSSRMMEQESLVQDSKRETGGSESKADCFRYGWIEGACTSTGKDFHNKGGIITKC